MNLFVQHGYLLKYDSDGKSYGAWPHWGEHNDFRSGKSEYPAPLKGLLPRNPPQSPQNVNVNVKMNVEIENEGEIAQKLKVKEHYKELHLPNFREVRSLQPGRTYPLRV